MIKVKIINNTKKTTLKISKLLFLSPVNYENVLFGEIK